MTGVPANFETGHDRTLKRRKVAGLVRNKSLMPFVHSRATFV